MRLLFVTPYLPGPPIFGGQRRMHGLMTHLAESHEVSIVSLVDGETDQSKGVRDAREYCKNVVTVPSGHHRIEGRGKRLLQLRSVVSRKSYERLLHHRPAFQQALERHLSENQYDVINCEFVFMASYKFFSDVERKRPRLTLDEHNVEYDLLRRTASSGSLDRQAFNAVNWRKLRREEIAAWNRFDGCTLTSQRDESFVNRRAPGVRTAVIPNGVDVDAFRPMPEVPVEPMTVLFFGAINYFPNTDGALFFLERVLPILEATHPSVLFRIVGPGAPDSVVAWRGKRVEIKGFVPDLQSEIARATVVVAPLRMGGGTRLKILEAMAMGKSVVSTTIGAEGLDVAHDENVLIADTPQGIARELGNVLDNAALRDRLGRAARLLTEERYGWRAAAKKLATFYEELSSVDPKSGERPGNARVAEARTAI